MSVRVMPKFGAELRSGSVAQMKKAGNLSFFIK